MKREHVLGVLYDLSLTIGGEISLKPLLSKTLQKLLHHTGYPCGMVLLKKYDQRYNIDEFCLTTVIGDMEALKAVDTILTLPPFLLDGKVADIHDPKAVADLPCKQGKYQFMLKLPIGQEGMILLLAAQTVHNQLPLQQMFSPILSHLSKAIHLCRSNDLQKEVLQQQVDERTKEIQEREEQMRLLLATTAEGIFGLDMEGRCTFVNASALKYLGYSHESELIGKIIHPIIHHTKADGSPYPIEECRNFIATRLGEQAHVDDELYWRKDGSGFPVEYRSMPIIKDGEAVGQIITFTDITQRLHDQQQKLEAQRKIEHTQRLESLGVLTGGIAHDFNNLLTAILGNTTLAQQKMDQYSHEYELLNQVIEASESAADLCKQMLAYSGKGKFTIAPVNLSDLIEKMAKLLDVSIHKRTMVRYDLARNLPLIEGDVAQLRQVMMNLITNANEALEGESGVISITTGTMTIDENYLATAYLEANVALGEYVYIEVGDTGCGMNAEERSKVFEPFYTTKVSGRGLGMSAMLGIVRGHAGTLKIYSEVGKGTLIKVMFPVSKSAVLEVEEPKKKELNAQGQTILVIDDELMLRKVSTSMLSRLGFTVITAENGMEGVKQYIEHQQDITLVLLDMMMPVMNGEETFQKLRAINPEVKVLLCSGYNEQEATQRFTGKGLAGFIQKPYRLQSISDAISEILAS